MIPTIDPKVRHVGSSYLRGLNSDQLRQLEGAVVVQDSGDQPLVVIVPYETYLKLQETAVVSAEMDIEGFDQRRQEVRERITRGARQPLLKPGEKRG